MKTDEELKQWENKDFLKFYNSAFGENRDQELVYPTPERIFEYHWDKVLPLLNKTKELKEENERLRGGRNNVIDEIIDRIGPYDFDIDGNRTIIVTIELRKYLNSLKSKSHDPNYII